MNIPSTFKTGKIEIWTISPAANTPVYVHKKSNLQTKYLGATYHGLIYTSSQSLGPRTLFSLKPKTSVLRTNFVKFESQKICLKRCQNTLKFDRYLSNSAAELPFKFIVIWWWHFSIQFHSYETSLGVNFDMIITSWIKTQVLRSSQYELFQANLEKQDWNLDLFISSQQTRPNYW